VFLGGILTGLSYPKNLILILIYFFGLNFLESTDGGHLMSSSGKSRAYHTSTKASSQYIQREGNTSLYLTNNTTFPWHYSSTYFLSFLASIRGLCVMDDFLKLIAVHWENLKRLDV